MRKIASTEQALSAVKRAMRLHRPMTLSYTRANGSDTVRTIEPYALTRNAAGDLYVRAMDRESGQSRTWRLDRMVAYTEHRTAFLVPVPEPKSEASRVTAVRVAEVEQVLRQETVGEFARRVSGAPEYQLAGAR
jgi:predicted DNA-binding transcriptional regulator YafY